MQVAAGETHTLFLTEDSKVYAVGDNSHCQLARRHEQAPYIHQPIQIDGLSQIASIACKQYSTAITSSGDLFIWGCGPFGDYEAPYRVSGMPG